MELKDILSKEKFEKLSESLDELQEIPITVHLFKKWREEEKELFGDDLDEITEILDAED